MLKVVLKVIFSKGTTLSFALAYTLLIVLGTTFSWITSSEQKANEFAGELGLETVIVEDFTQEKQWQPGTDIVKTVYVYNKGQSAGFARISFEEIVEMFDHTRISEPYADPQENGVIPEYCLTDEWSSWQDAAGVFNAVVFHEGEAPVTIPEGVTVKVKTSPAGLQRYKYAIYQVLDGGQAYRRMTAQFSAQSDTLTVINPRYWGYQNSNVQLEAAWGLVSETNLSEPEPPAADDIDHLVCDTGKKISINYTNLIKTLTGTAADNDKWYYNEDDGFFYYIGKLNSGSTSKILMTGLSLDLDADIGYSDLDLQLIVHLDALQVNATALKSNWGLTNESDPLYQALVSFC